MRNLIMLVIFMWTINIHSIPSPPIPFEGPVPPPPTELTNEINIFLLISASLIFGFNLIQNYQNKKK